MSMSKDEYQCSTPITTSLAKHPMCRDHFLQVKEKFVSFFEIYEYHCYCMTFRCEGYPCVYSYTCDVMCVCVCVCMDVRVLGM